MDDMGLPPLQLGEVDAGLLKNRLQSADPLDLGASIKRTIQRLKPFHHRNRHTRSLRENLPSPL